MQLHEIRKVLHGEAYDFLRTNPHLGSRVMLLGLGGSHAYGTDTETSDLDIRGCAVLSKAEILCGESFEQVTDVATDTTVYAFPKLIRLLKECNPNTIEILGLKPEHYLYLSEAGKLLLDNRKLFLSQRAVNSFSGYATAQFRRMDNKSARIAEQPVQEMHILNSIRNAKRHFPEQFFQYPEDAIRLYIDDAVNPQMQKEIFMDISLKHYPLRDYKEMWGRMADIVKSYSRVGQGHRNQNAVTHNKLSKHMMHLIRLYLMCIDILEKGEVITYRAAEHDFLMRIRNGEYLDENQQPTAEFFEIIEQYKASDHQCDDRSFPDRSTGITDQHCK